MKTAVTVILILLAVFLVYFTVAYAVRKGWTLAGKKS